MNKTIWIAGAILLLAGSAAARDLDPSAGSNGVTGRGAGNTSVGISGPSGGGDWFMRQNERIDPNDPRLRDPNHPAAGVARRNGYVLDPRTGNYRPRTDPPDRSNPGRGQVDTGNGNGQDRNGYGNTGRL